ncbi:MAG: hypothetical protein HDS92_05385 [Bacteroidales bacterium]|nr:hypothetical protein [Bacteroidales bacterium]
MFSFLKKNKTPRQLFFATDVHCHIVPGVDDGSPDLETSLELLERMRSWGLRHVITTPHMTQDTFENTTATLDPAFAVLKEGAAKAGIDVKLERTAEHRIDEFFTEQLEKGDIVPYPNNYLLVENSFVQEPYGLDRLLFDLKLKGYKPILAHPERFRYYQLDPSRYDMLRQAGNLFQLNILSLAGYYGKETKQMAEKLVEKGYIDFLGTDLHHHEHADAIEDYLASKDYRKLCDRGIELMNDTAF